MENQIIRNQDTEIFKLKLAAKGSDNKLRSFFESSSVIHLLINTEFKVIDYNKAAQLFIKKHYKVDPQYGIKITECIHKQHLSGFKECYKKSLAGIPSRVERIFDYGSEKIVWFLAYEPATDCDGNVIGMSFNAVDISEKVASDEKISSQFRSLNEIAHIHSHNLRKPIANIVGLMDIFKSNDYSSSHEELLMLEKAIAELKSQLEEIEYFHISS